MFDTTERAQRWTTLVLLAVLAALLLAFGVPRIVHYYAYWAELGRQNARFETELKHRRAEAEGARDTLRSFPDGSEQFRQVVKSVAPAVVHIDTLTQVQTRRPRDPIFAPFVNPEEQRGLGSGVVIDERGYVLTNYHVVGDASALRIVLADGRYVDQSREQLLVGADPMLDLALLKINLPNLVHAPLGDSDKLAVGDWVLAVGNPFGLDQSVTAGIVSGTGRGDNDTAGYEHFIQTDAAINLGNSGGPLASLHGEVIGINTSIVGRAGNLGIGFAIPSNMAKPFFDQLITKGRVVRGWLGVSWQRLPSEEVVIGEVFAYGPAAEAGLRKGDRVASFAGVEIRSWRDFRRLVALAEVDRPIEIELLREGRSHKVTLRLREFPSTQLGYQVRTVTPGEAEYLGYGAGAAGVLVSVFPQSRAERAGLRNHELIVAVRQEPVTDFLSYLKAISAVDLGGSVALQVLNPTGVVRAVLIPAEGGK